LGKKNNKKALARAQKVIGDKAKKSDIKKLEAKGFNSKVIQKAVKKAPEVGNKAATRVERKHTSSSGSSSGSAPKRVHTSSGTKVLWDPKKGKLHNKSADVRYAHDNRNKGTPLTKDSRSEINKMVNKKGYSFSAPKSGQFNTVNLTVGVKGSKERHGTGDGSYYKTTPNSKDSVTLYKAIKSKTKSGGGKGEGKGGGGHSSGSSSRGDNSKNVPGGGTTYEPYSGAPKDPALNSKRPGDVGPPSLGNKPSYAKGTLGPDGSGIQTHWSDTPERLADYGQRMDTYNRENIDWLGRRGEQQERRSAFELAQLAGAMPKQKEEKNPYKDVLDFVKRAGA
jgi:hypothetical protein